MTGNFLILKNITRLSLFAVLSLIHNARHLPIMMVTHAFEKSLSAVANGFQ